MFYVQKARPVCTGGPVGFCRLRDGVQLGLLCSTCDALFDAPDGIDARRAQFAPNAGLAAEAHADWAGQNEVALRGWLHDVAGEWVEDR